MLSGVVGLAIGTALYVVACHLSDRMSHPLEEAVLVGAVFVVLFLVALAEMPMMVYVLRRLMRGSPRVLLVGINAGYVAFASVYAAVYLLVTHEGTGAMVLAGLSILRFLSGFFV